MSVAIPEVFFKCICEWTKGAGKVVTFRNSRCKPEMFQVCFFQVDHRGITLFNS